MSKIIDLTFPIHEGMTTFPVHWHPVVEITKLGRHGIENRQTHKFLMGTHTGTHCDAPVHFIPGGKSIDQMPLDTFIGPAFVADFTASKPGTEIDVKDLERVLQARRPERLILRFGWDSHWGTMAYYLNHPFISDAAASWLADRGVKLLGMDTPMPDNPLNGRGTPNDSPVHKILLGREVILVEYLCNLQALKKSDVHLIVLPLNILGMDGSPVRCVVVEE